MIKISICKFSPHRRAYGLVMIVSGCMILVLALLSAMNVRAASHDRNLAMWQLDDLSLQNSANVATVSYPGEITYSIIVVNGSPDRARNVTVLDDLPVHAVLDESTLSQIGERQSMMRPIIRSNGRRLSHPKISQFSTLMSPLPRHRSAGPTRSSIRQPSNTQTSLRILYNLKQLTLSPQNQR